MENDIFKYIGIINKNYVFINSNEKEVKFTKCRKELIKKFKLDNTKNINKWYRINYFIIKSQDYVNEFGGMGIYIISDMEILKK
jgi:hypothetical protein